MRALLALAVILADAPCVPALAATKKATPSRELIPKSGWTVLAPAGFTEMVANGRLQWKRDVLLPPTAGGTDGGTQLEYITASPQALPAGLVSECTREAQERGIEGLREALHRGKRLATYVCPGHTWSETDGDSDSWRCLLEVDRQDGIEINFWSTWLKVQDGRRLNRDRTEGLKAFRAVCESLERSDAAGQETPAPRTAEPALLDCAPDGFDARVQKVDFGARSFEVLQARPGMTRWSSIGAALDASVRLDGRDADFVNLREADWVHVQRDCMTGLAKRIAVARNRDGSPGGPRLRPELLRPADRQALEGELRGTAGRDPWEACLHVGLFQSCVMASR